MWFLGPWVGAVAGATPVVLCSDSNTGGCLQISLADALAQGHLQITLGPGIHRPTETAIVDEDNVTIEGLGAQIVPLSDDAPVLLVEEAADNTRLQHLALLPGDGIDDGPLVVIKGDSTTLVAPDIHGRLSPQPAIRIDGASSVRIEGPDLRGNRPVSLPLGTQTGYPPSPVVYALVSLIDAEVILSDGLFDGNLELDSAIDARRSRLRIEDTTFSGVPGLLWRQLRASDSEVTIVDSVFEGDIASEQILAFEGELRIRRSRLAAPGNALVVSADQGRLEVTDTVLETGSGYAIRAIRTDEVRIRGDRFLPLADRAGRAIELFRVDEATIARSWFCHGSATVGVVAWLSASCGQRCVFENDYLVDNEVDGGGVVEADGGEIALRNLTAVDNRSVSRGGAVSVGPDGSLSVRRSLFVGSGGPGPTVSGPVSIFEHNAFGDDPGPLVTAPWSDGDNLREIEPVWLQEADPCGPALLAEDEANRWLLDHRVGALPPCYEDRDGDAFGGAWMPQGAVDCTDVGGVLAGGDCDDSDASVYPGAGCETPTDTGGGSEAPGTWRFVGGRCGCGAGGPAEGLWAGLFASMAAGWRVRRRSSDQSSRQNRSNVSLSATTGR